MHFRNKHYSKALFHYCKSDITDGSLLCRFYNLVLEFIIVYGYPLDLHCAWVELWKLMLVIHWSQARYGSLKIKGRKRPALNAMTYTSMDNWVDYWCVGRCVHFIRQPVCSYSSLSIRAVDFQLFHWYTSRSIYYFYQQVCTYSECHELE